MSRKETTRSCFIFFSLLNLTGTDKTQFACRANNQKVCTLLTEISCLDTVSQRAETSAQTPAFP